MEAGGTISCWNIWQAQLVPASQGQAVPFENNYLQNETFP